MDPVKRQALLMNRERFAELIPVEAYDEDEEVFYIRGSDKREYIGAVFVGSPLIGADEGTTAMIRSAMAGDMPDDSLMQISYLSSSFIDNMVALWSKPRLDIMRRSDGLYPAQKEILNALYESRREFLLSGAEKPIVESSGVRLKNTTLILSLKIPVSKTPNDRELSDAKAAIMRFRESFKTVGLSPRPLNGRAYLMLMRSILFMGKEPSRTYDDDQIISEQIMPYDSDMAVSAKEVRINDTYIRSLSTQTFPDIASIGLLNQLIGDPMGSHNQISDPFMMTLTVYFPEQAKIMKTIRKSQGAINYQAQGQWAKFAARIGTKKENYDILDQSLEDGNRPIKLWFNSLIFSSASDDAARAASRMRTFFQMHGYEVSEDKYMHGPFMLMQLPLICDVEAVPKSARFYTMTIREAAQMPPVIGEWKGTGRGAAMSMAGRRGQLLVFDLFDSQTNYNCVIAAESGAGKSFLANDMIVSYLQKGAKVRMIDQGRSYEKLCEVLGGEYIEFDADRAISLNPFTHVKDIDEEMDLLAIIIAKMASPTQGFSDWEISATVQVIKELWDEYGNATTITDVAERFQRRGEENNQDIRLINIAQQLYQFTRHGTYGKYFDGPNTLDYNNNLVVLELDQLRSKKDLQQVVMLQLIAQLQTECYLGDRGVQKLIGIDEAWEQMEDPMVAKFLEGAYRRFRKYHASCLIISQSLDDLYNSQSGKAIAKNSANTIVLRQSGEAIEGLKKSEHFKVGPYGFEMLRSLHTERGQYSDLMLRQGDAWGVGRFVVEPFSQLLYSTSPDDVMAIDRLREQGLSTVDAINHLIDGQRPDLADVRKRDEAGTTKRRMSA